MGVDGGGSRCRARLRDGEGRLLASVHGGAANVHVDFDGAVARPSAMLETLWTRPVWTGLPGAAEARPRPCRRVVPDGRRAGRGGARGLEEVKVVNDAVTACLGAHAGQDGGLIIAGTGSAGVARVAGVDTIIGGRGFMLGDDGSGARIGHSAWRRALRAHDGLEPATDFTRKLMAQYDDDPVAVIRWGQRARPSDYGAYAPATFAAASAGDPVALDIVHEAATALSDLALAVRALGADRLSMVGGVADAVRPYLVPEVPTPCPRR